ncbi:hypothetical protein BS17DRAFT_797303 [Gyrodon lividus]|nr:hypothetical protein BS17DRAFT_797303 [Gyrodon lividus]
MCCLEGQVQLPALQQWPDQLKRLYDDHHALAFTSMGAEVDHHTVQGAGPTFCIHGALHHLMGSLIPNEGHDPCYAQQTLADLHDMLFNFHPYVNIYKQAYQHPDLHVQLHFTEGTDARRYNLPTINEIAAIIPGDGSEALNENHDIVLQL